MPPNCQRSKPTQGGTFVHPNVSANIKYKNNTKYNFVSRSEIKIITCYDNYFFTF